MNSSIRKKMVKSCLVLFSVFYFFSFGQETNGSTFTAKIEGLVTDMQGASISNADITLFKYGTGDVSDVSRTDFYGRFIIDNIFIDTNGYYLQIDHEEGAVYPRQYWHQNQNTLQIPNKRIRLRSGNVFNVHIQLTSQPLSFSDTTFYDISSIMGNTVDENHQALTGIKVYATTADTVNLDIVDSAITDSEGKFILYRVPAFLSHFLLFDPGPNSNSGLPMQFWSHDTMTSFPQQEITTESYNTLNLGELKILRQPAQGTMNQDFAEVKVILLDLENRPVKNSCYLSLMKGTDVISKSLEAGFLDTFIVFHDVSEGNYSLYLDVDGYPQQYYNPQGNTMNNIYEFHVNVGEQKYIDVRLTQNPGNEGVPNFSGYIKNSAGEPIVNAKVLVLDTLNLYGDFWINISHHWTEFSTITDNNGYYAIFDVVPGKYILLAGSADENYRSVFYPNSPLIKDASLLEIINNSTAHTANFTLIPGSEVIGYVKDESGIGISNISVNLFRSHDDDSTKKRAINLFFEAKSNINGKFKFLGIPEGEWYITAHDPSDIYLLDHNDWEDFVTNGSNTTFVDNITMKAGGSMYGTYTVSTDSMHHGHLGNIFIHTETVSDTDESDKYWSRWHTSIITSEEPGKYRTHAIPAGRWKMVISPDPHLHTDLFNIPDNLNFMPSYRWSFIDGASTLILSNTIVIESFKKTTQNIVFQSGGHIVFGNIRTEKNEQLGNTNTLSSNYRHYHVRAYIKEAGDRFIQISESFDMGNNRFALSGLVEGGHYYFNANAEDYADQWWNAIPDSSTYKEKNAAAYTFSTTNFSPINIYLMKKPEGFDQSHQEGPPAVKNQTIVPLGLTSVSVHWSPSAAEHNVVKYLVYKVKNVKKDMFFLNEWGWWEPVNDDSIVAHLDSFFVTDTFFIDSTVTPGVNYMYVAVGIDNEDHEGEVLPKGAELDKYIIKISHETFKKVTKTIYSERWQMVGICGLDSVILDSTRAGIKMFRWDETADSSKLHSYYQRVDTLNPGSGAWIYSYKQIPLYLSRNSYSNLVAKRDSIFLTLKKGWNQVSSPFPYGVTPLWIVNDFVSYGWNSLNNSYYETKSLKPWNAYWIHSTVDTVLKVTPVPTTVRKNLLNKRSGKGSFVDGWELSVSLIGRRSSDPENYIGIISRESSARRIQESPEPPQAFDFPQLYFTYGKEKLSKHYIVSDAIPSKKLEWKVGISRTVEKMDVIVKGISSIPKPVGLFWVTNSGAQNLREKNSITLTPEAESRFGYIVATASPIDIALYTGRFMLRGNYPNPFKKSTILEFTVPYTWSKNGSKSGNDKQTVSLTVYNIAGKQVATLHSGKIDVGHHRKVWDGKNNLGQSLPSGVYIARLKSVKYCKAIRMFRIK